LKKKRSQNAGKFQCLISGTLTSGEFAWAISTNGGTVGTWFANGFIDLCLY